jgi:Uma2 family endonuclease
MNAAATALGPLIAGDRLTREEFVRRWEEMPELKRAELIGGQVYMPSPLSASHDRTSTLVAAWLWAYSQATPGCQSGANATWYMLHDAPQPDAHLRILPEYGGRCFVKDDFYHGAPELAVEVALSSTSYDLHQKKELYAKAGVKEYLAVLLKEREVRWGRLVAEDYQQLTVYPDGSTRSLVFPGLWLDARALLDGNTARLLEVLQQGLNSPEHAEFVERLAGMRKDQA